MKPALSISLVLVVLSSCQFKDEQTNWKWDSNAFTPSLITETDTTNYWGTDTLYAGDAFKAKLFRKFKTVRDSANQIDFKGYVFKVKKKMNSSWAYDSSWSSMSTYMKVRNDTAYLDIPVDSLLTNADSTIAWYAGYTVTFHQNGTDTLYAISGTWHIAKK